MNIFIGTVKKYCLFSGRASRKEFWIFFLVYFLGGVILSTIDFFLAWNGLLRTIWEVSLFLPFLGVAIRRLHDINRKGWWVLVPFYNLYLFSLDGEQEENSFGSIPVL
ncbi:DUF805 domain-containing protein [Buttiauxella sp. 3AFRM03]|uniref:DUF805 domain-containing protein n=1 Tax=Buttiauxella sp. 3AFRM03 TaxID=2479367 RepID=UPI000EF784BC|nr:DUF805 domain-containing protein [Buttiauxella sp. 3AFRM03]AYN27024.1 DUF805 domain-containing protein [Buttiauxella sp. 3AFRM03]